MLPPASSLLFLPPIVGSGMEASAPRAAGVLADLAELVARLGDVHARAMSGEGNTSWERGELRAEDPGVLAALLAGRQAQLAVVVRVTEEPARLILHVQLLEPDGTSRWSGRATLTDDALIEARLALAANLIEAATGRRKDIRRGRRGGTTVLDAYRRLCEARAPGVAAERRSRLLADAIALDPDYLEAQLLLADAYEAAGSPVRARRVLAMLCRRFPHYAPARMRHGLSLRSGGRYDEAIDEVQGALEADPDGMVLFQAGLFAEADGDQDTASLLYERAIERGCVDAVLCDRLARIRAREGRPGEASLLWGRAREVEPGRDDLIGDLALAHHRAGDSSEAERLFEEAIETASGRYRTQASRALYLKECGRDLEALEASSRALSLNAQSAEMYNLRGEARMALQDRWGARRDLMSALEHEDDPELAFSIRTNLARLARGRRTAEAEDIFLAALRRYREGAADALPGLEEVLALDPQHWQAWLLVGLIQRDRGGWKEAAEAFAEVVRIRGSHPQAQSERGLALLALGRGEDALRFARSACEEEPSDASLLSNLGLVLMEQSHLEEAKEVFLRAREIEPADPVLERCLAELKDRRRKDPRWGSSWTQRS